MRNLSLITSPSCEEAMRAFRRFYMEQTATWAVLVKICTSGEEALAALEQKAHAHVVSPDFRTVLFDETRILAPSCALSSGGDVRYQAPRGTMGLSQVARALIDALEETFLPLYGARVALIGSQSAALDGAYEFSRAGAAEVMLLDADKDRARDNLRVFLNTFKSRRTQIIDADQALVGHVSATRAYDETRFTYGALSALSLIESADIIVSFVPSAQLLSSACIWPLRTSQIVCDPWGSLASPLNERASACGCDILTSSDVMRAWAHQCHAVLQEFCAAKD